MTDQEKELAIRCAVITGLIAKEGMPVSGGTVADSMMVEAVERLTRILLEDAILHPLT